MEEIGSLGNDSVYYSDDEYTYEDKSEDGQEDAECVTLPSSSNVIQNVDESGYNSRLSDVNRSGFTEHEDNSRVLDYIASEGITMKNSDFQVLDKEGVTLLMNKLVDDIAGLAAVEIPVAEALLRYCRWDREKVTDKFLVDSQKFLHEAGVDKYHEQRIKACEDNGFEIVGASQTRVSPSADEMAGQTFLCHICYDDAAKLSESFNMSCGHLFCKDCFGEYLRNQVSDGPSCVLACCPEIDCKCSVTSDIFRELLDGDSLKQYERYLLGSYIEASSRVFKYCPGVGCDKVIRGSGAVTVRCTCEECFCFSCGEEGHMPCNCKQVASWNEKCASESGSINWILV